MSQEMRPMFHAKDLCIYSLNPLDIPGRKVCRILGLKPSAEWKNKNIPEYIVHIFTENEKIEARETDLEEI